MGARNSCCHRSIRCLVWITAVDSTSGSLYIVRFSVHDLSLKHLILYVTWAKLKNSKYTSRYLMLQRVGKASGVYDALFLHGSRKWRRILHLYLCQLSTIICGHNAAQVTEAFLPSCPSYGCWQQLCMTHYRWVRTNKQRNNPFPKLG